MLFSSPEWFCLLPLLALIGWRWRRLQLWLPLRVAILLLIVLILSNPKISKLKEGLDLWVLLDRSASTEGLVDNNLEEWKKLLEKSKPSDHDELIFVDFAGEVQEQSGSDGAVFSGNRNLTRTGLAIESTLAKLRADKPARILLFSDGFSTEPIGDLATKLSSQGIPLDFRLVREELGRDYRVRRLQMPGRVQISEPFLIEIEVTGRPDGKIPVTVSRGTQTLTEPGTEIDVVDGRGMLRFTDRIGKAGAYKYNVLISPESDTHLGNNMREAWIEVTGGPRVILVTKYLNDPVAASLEKQGFEVRTATLPKDPLNVGLLTGCRAVILNNVPAFELPNDFLRAMDFFVREQGGGLLMAGGKQSFGAGGYFQSAIDKLLPISMELKTEHRKLAVAMAIVMDRSGSMSASVPGGPGGGTVSKMDLANEGAARAIELLGGQDKLTVYAVDTAAHPVAGLTKVEGNRRKLISTVRSVESTGGGIFVYEGLKAAWDSLKKAEVGMRHIILFSDAADSERLESTGGKLLPEVETLVREMLKGGASISVIALGSKSDQHYPALANLAKLANGRLFLTSVPKQIPNIFAQETVAVARSAFIDEPIGAHPTGHWQEISAKPLQWQPSVDAYNLSYLRPKSTAALLTKDEYEAPLIAYAQRGVGRSVAVSFPLGGKFSETIRSWNQYGDFLQTLTRWTMGEEMPPGIGLRHTLRGTRLSLDLVYDGAEWEEKFSKVPPRVVVARGESGAETSELIWQRMAPGHFSISTDLVEGEVLRGAVQVGGQAIPFGPIVVGSSAEWAFDPIPVAELRQVSAISGGRELLNLSEAWVRPPAEIYSEIRTWLLIALVSLIVLEALLTRLGYAWPDFGFLAWRKRRRQLSARAIKAGSPIPSAASPGPAAAAEDKATPDSLGPGLGLGPGPRAESPPPPEDAGKSAARRRSRFGKAKRRGL